MSEGFYKRRRGILEHLETGTIGLLDLAIHDYLCLKINAVRGSECSIPAGVCFTSAAAIYAVCPKEVAERTIRRSLEHLEAIGWIKRWTIPGKHGNYPVLVARASVHDLSGKEYRVNAEATTDWRFPVYASGEESASTRRGDVRGLSAYREKRVESREERETQIPPVSVSPVSPANSLEQETKAAAFEVFWERWPKKEAKGAGQRAWIKIPMAEYPAIMAGLERWLLSDQWKRGVIPHPATWLNGKRWQDEDIPQFVERNDGNTNRKQSATDLAMQNARALGLNRVPN